MRLVLGAGKSEIAHLLDPAPYWTRAKGETGKRQEGSEGRGKGRTRLTWRISPSKITFSAFSQE